MTNELKVSFFFFFPLTKRDPHAFNLDMDVCNISAKFILRVSPTALDVVKVPKVTELTNRL